MTYKNLQKLSGKEVLEFIERIPMEKWNGMITPDRELGCHAYYEMSGTVFHAEISGISRNPDSQANQCGAEIWVDGYKIGESRSKGLQGIYNGIMQWKRDRDDRFVELLRLDRKAVHAETTESVRKMIGK
ncbi:MAG: hypothetical protein M1520_00055 [Candidatus Marsarchaeota archaeon]|jgi:hypothetical protein|nr:hypothetical protein [Candidatus Marsarchaeota archaeon]